MVLAKDSEELLLMLKVFQPLVPSCEEVINKSPAVLDVVLLEERSDGSLKECWCILESKRDS